MMSPQRDIIIFSYLKGNHKKLGAYKDERKKISNDK